MKDYFQSPVDNSWVNFAGHPNGDAMDLGWREALKNFNQPVHAMADGIVVWAGWLDDGGNAVVIKHEYKDGKDAWVGLMHFKNPAIVKVGDRVKRGQKVGNMGNTGVSGGEHVHVRLSLVPQGSGFNWDLFNSTRVNPFNYVYEFSHQDVLDMKKKPSTPFIQPSSDSGKQYINIHKGPKYGTYSMDVAPVRKNISQWLRPDNLGGLSYEIQSKTKDPNVFIIETRDFGKRQIFLDKTRASITDKPLYKVYGKTSGGNQSKPKPVFKPYNKTLKTGSKLYDSNGNAYAKPTTNTHNVKVLQEKNGLGLIRESWLIGVSEAWIKL